jgi:hypothetical protein
MNRYPAYSVIEWKGVVGIICGWDGHFATVMFEDGRNGVAFANYSEVALYRFRVIG